MVFDPRSAAPRRSRRRSPRERRPLVWRLVRCVCLCVGLFVHSLVCLFARSLLCVFVACLRVCVFAASFVFVCSCASVGCRVPDPIGRFARFARQVPHAARADEAAGGESRAAPVRSGQPRAVSTQSTRGSDPRVLSTQSTRGSDPRVLGTQSTRESDPRVLSRATAAHQSAASSTSLSGVIRCPDYQ